jgi:hypothetical protein
MDVLSSGEDVLIMVRLSCVPRGWALRDEMWVVSYFLWCDHVTCV